MACVGSERHNVFTEFQKVNCPHTAKVVNKDGPVVERHEMRPHDITVDPSEGFDAIVATLRTPEHCITCGVIHLGGAPRANICNGGFVNAPRPFKRMSSSF